MPKHHMKIAVVGNCQAIGLANCLGAVLPSGEVTFHRPRSGIDWKALGAASDCVVFQGRRGDREAVAIAAGGAKPITFPAISFAAYHPDIIHLDSRGDKIRSGIGPYHSALAILGWKAGLSAEDTLKLYTGEVFGKLGYYRFWDSACEFMQGRSRLTDIPVEGMIEAWAARGPFMHTTNHPQLRVVADIANRVLDLIGVGSSKAATDPEVEDHLAKQFIIPVYPEVAASLGIEGSYVFHFPGRTDKRERLNLDEVVARCFKSYEALDLADVHSERLEGPEWKTLFNDIRRKQFIAVPPNHPYKQLPVTSFWGKAVSDLPPDAIDPIVSPPFQLDKTTRIATAGSCFAQHIAKALERRGFSHLREEDGPDNAAAPGAGALVDTPFSAHYGNIYTARQLRQLIDRASGRFAPVEPAWRRHDGRVVDPFRPRVFAAGFDSIEAMLAARETHLRAVQKIFQTLDTFIFTLGLTEAWQSIQDGAVFPIAPGAAGGTYDPHRHAFTNARMIDVVRDVLYFQRRLRNLNPNAKTILTVSPVPLVATYENRHVLVSTASSKAKLRAAVDEIVQADPSIWYFPSYEIVTGSFSRGRYFEDDLRSVTPAGVDHVMRLFFSRLTKQASQATDELDRVAAEAAVLERVVCDEEELAR